MPVLADEPHVAKLINQLATQIRADISAPSSTSTSAGWALVGLRSRGDVLARRLASILNPDHVGVLDITLYRDDLSEIASQPVVRSTEIDFPIDNLNIVLVDDVLMTGRSIRAALQSLMDLGRPRRVWLSVLVDRGGRELPIAPDHVALDLTGKNSSLPSLTPDQTIEVHLKPTDPHDQILIRSKSLANSPT